MVNIDCSKIVRDLADKFKNNPYPYIDFYKAISDRDYIDIHELNPENNTKEWNSINLKTLLKYYDFLLFLDFDGQKYYLPTYITSVLNNKNIHDTWIFDTLMQVLIEIDVHIFNEEQKKVLLNALECIRQICNDCDREMLQQAISNIRGA
jgi:hypothetical protein